MASQPDDQPEDRVLGASHCRRADHADACVAGIEMVIVSPSWSHQPRTSASVWREAYGGWYQSKFTRSLRLGEKSSFQKHLRKCQ